jgi:hypothetical protein
MGLQNRTCDISMPGNVSNAIRKFQHDAPKHPQHTPSRYLTFMYGAKTQYAKKMKHRHSRPNNVSPYRKSPDPFCTTPDLWTQPSSCHSMIFPQRKPRRLKSTGHQHDITHLQRCLIHFRFQRTRLPLRSVLIRQATPPPPNTIS